MVNESNDLSVYRIFQNMEKELRENFEGLDMYFGYHDDDYEDISAFNMPDITIYYAGAKLESIMMMTLTQSRCNSST